MIDFDNQTDFSLNLESIEDIVKFITKRDFELILVGNNKIKDINKEYRDIDKATDVLSFPLDLVCDNMPIGTIIISIDFVKEVASKMGHSEIDELKLLLIHGLLHLIGYDHEIDNGEMREKEEEIIKHFNLPDSLIVRSEK
jgi:probable rRNA maturation factor